MDKKTEILGETLSKVGMSDIRNSYTPNNFYFKVNGAGKIRITEETQYQCDDVEGFSFGIEWGKYGFAGGVNVQR